MRTDESYLLDMLLAARKIKQFTEGMTQETFDGSELHQSAIIRELQVIGEAARSISQSVKDTYPEIEWVPIGGLRNRIIHEYFRLRLEVIWEAVETDIAPLIAALEAILPSDEKS
jgi:uncharacterized protein with HEPN domain